MKFFASLATLKSDLTTSDISLLTSLLLYQTSKRFIAIIAKKTGFRGSKRDNKGHSGCRGAIKPGHCAIKPG